MTPRASKADFGDGPQQYENGVMVSFDAAGNVRWVRRSANYERPIAVDSAGRLFAAGVAGAGMPLAPGVVLGGVAVGFNSYVIAFGVAGGYLWHRSWVGASYPFASYAYAPPKDGSLVLGGTTGEGGGRAVVHELSMEGAPIWTFQPVSADGGRHNVQSVAVAPNGTVVASGVFEGQVTFGSTSLVSKQAAGAGSQYGTIWLAKLRQ